jgi:hypothetical protein
LEARSRHPSYPRVYGRNGCIYGRGISGWRYGDNWRVANAGYAPEAGKFSVTDGPFIELKELTGGFAVIQANSLEEAVEWCKRFRKIVGDGESEIVPIFGPQ